MAKTVKRILCGAVCLALLFTMLCMSGCNKSYIGSSKQTLEKLNIQAQIIDNGDMNVVETWKVNLKNRGKDGYRHIYKTFSMLPKDKDFVENFSVYDEDNHMEYEKVTNKELLNPYEDKNKCYLFRTPYEQELGLYMPEISEGVRTFTFRYTVKRQVNSYKDTSIFYYKFISTDFTVPITDMSCTIKLPVGSKKEDLHAWLHCKANSKLTIDSGSQITITASEIPAKTNIETRICMPTKLFSFSTFASEENMLEGIINQEEKWASEWQAKQNEKYIRARIDMIGAIVLILLGVVIFLYNRHKRKRYQVEVPEYTRDIPPGNTPAGIANLYYYYDSGITTTKRGYVYSATFLELARKGYLTFSDQNETGLTVNLAEKCTFENWVDLSPNETAFLSLILSVPEKESHSFTMAQFEEYAKANYEFVNNALDDFLDKSEEEISQRGYFENKNVITHSTTLVGMLITIVGACMLFAKAPLSFIPIAALISGILLIVSRWGQKPLSEIGEREYKVWHGLKKYMLEFSRMKEYGVPQLALWEEYLVYATMMGISKQVCKQLTLVYPEVCDPNYRNANWVNSSYMFFMFDYHADTPDGSWDTDLGTILSDRISTIHDEVDTLMNPPSSNSGDGGGYGGDGGGGGGFDGGGGGFDGGGGGID